MWLELILRRISESIEISSSLIETSKIVELRISHEWLGCVVQMNSVATKSGSNWRYEREGLKYVLRLEF